jgi:methylenetetrahydrofolate dehydrogenase (NADP+)/methenyltetrahydrofolate cyclohydrolase
MPGKILKGDRLAQDIKSRLWAELVEIKRKVNPYVVAVCNAKDPASEVYRRMQHKLCMQAGINFAVRGFDPEVSEEGLCELIEGLSHDKGVTGISLHLPLPDHIDQHRVIYRISPDKDVEGVHPYNLGMLALGPHSPTPCAAQASVELLKSIDPNLKGKEITIVGHSTMVGKPIALLLLQSKMEAATPTVCHIATRELASHTRRADVLFVAVGKAGLITGDMVKPGCIVIDIGTNRLEDGRIVGDVCFEDVLRICSWITPVPGGVGPVALAILLRNILACAQKRQA